MKMMGDLEIWHRAQKCGVDRCTNRGRAAEGQSASHLFPLQPTQIRENYAGSGKTQKRLKERLTDCEGRGKSVVKRQKGDKVPWPVDRPWLWVLGRAELPHQLFLPLPPSSLSSSPFVPPSTSPKYPIPTAF